MQFGWDEDKAQSNLVKHGITFDYGTLVFEDANRLDRLDERNYDEDRWLTIGLVEGRELAVVYTVRSNYIRVISARKAEHRERRDYWKDR